MKLRRTSRFLARNTSLPAYSGIKDARIKDHDYVPTEITISISRLNHDFRLISINCAALEEGERKGREERGEMQH